MKLHLYERSAWTGLIYELRIESQRLSFIGNDHFQGRFPSEIPLKEEAVLSIKAALELLQVASWKPEYHPEDINVIICDGVTWGFEYQSGSLHFTSKGFTAYPSFESSSVTTCALERFALLREAIFSTLMPVSIFPQQSQTRRCKFGK